MVVISECGYMIYGGGDVDLGEGGGGGGGGGGEQYAWFGVDRSLLGFLGGSHPINYLFLSVFSFLLLLVRSRIRLSGLLWSVWSMYFHGVEFHC